MFGKLIAAVAGNPELAAQIEAGIARNEQWLADIERRIAEKKWELARTDKYADKDAARHFLRELEPEADYLRRTIRRDRASAAEARRGY